jgi:hypothetical protein
MKQSQTEVQIERAGKTYTGSFTIVRKMITVTYSSRSKQTQLGGSADNPKVLAKILLRELVEER